MANILGINVAAPIAPYTTDDHFATHDEQYGKGGTRSVADITERDAITVERRTQGMTCYVRSTDETWRLLTGITNADWVLLAHSASGYSGFSGYSGASGYSGISGYSGYSGYSGISGYSGPQGPQGPQGPGGGVGANAWSQIYQLADNFGLGDIIFDLGLIMFRNCHLYNNNSVVNVRFQNVPFPSVFWLTVDGTAESSITQIQYDGGEILWSNGGYPGTIGYSPNVLMFVAVEGTPPFVATIGSIGYTGTGDGTIGAAPTVGYNFYYSSFETFTLTFNGTSFNVVGTIQGPLGIVLPDVSTDMGGVSWLISTGGIPFSNGDAFTVDLSVATGGVATKLFGSVVSSYNNYNGIP